MNEQAVIINFDYGADSLDSLYELSDKLQEAIETAGVGEFDGHEISVDLRDGSLYMYGADAEALFEIVSPILIAASCLRNARATLRTGLPGSDERIEYL